MAHTSGLATSRWDRVVMTTRALPLTRYLAVAIAEFAKHKRTLFVVVEDDGSRRLRMSLLMREIDGSEGEDSRFA